MARRYSAASRVDMLIGASRDYPRLYYIASDVRRGAAEPVVARCGV